MSTTAKRTSRKKASSPTRKKPAAVKASPRKAAPKRTASRSTGRKKKAGTKATKKQTERTKAPRRSKKATSSARKKTASARRRGQPAPIQPFRLSTDVRPIDVDLAVAIEPNSSDAFRGSVGIEIEILRGRRSIELHAADLRVSQARVIVDERTLRGRIVPHPERQTIEVQLSESVPKGRARLELKFAGRLRKDLCGLYGATAGGRQYAFTQLEAADARKFFPCFDEPSMKARWQMTVTTSEANSVISNNPIEHTEKLPGGNKRVRFSRTPKLSSYLVALAVGELTCSRVTRAGQTAIRVWHVPGKQGMTAFSLDCARETLQRLERYFDLPYPYEKLDLVAVPDFEFGAMENAGAVFFRETLLLLDVRTVTLAEKKRAAEVICHELAHMWYGDLVTMAWWDDLWLNEAFATWMAFLIVDEWQPDWKMWHDFHHHRAGALELDALEHTHPIYVKVRTPDEANENFDLITYEKGAAVVRMMERYLGPEVFRAGVRAYIRRHAESNTIASDLWNALSEAAGQPVEPIVRAWIEQDGYPVVSVKRKQKNGRSAIELRQERFFEMQPTHARLAEEAKSARWPVPWVGRVGSDEEGPTTEVRHLLTRRVDTVDAPRADLGFVYGNADEGGFFRPLHGADELRDLIEALPVLNPAERMGLIDHQWALVRAGRANVSSLLDLIAATGAETNPDVLVTVKRALAMLASRFAPDVSRDTERRLRAWVEVYFGAQIDELGFDPAPDEHEATRVRRAAIIDIVGGIGEATRVVEEAQARCRKYLRQRSSLESNLADAVVSIAAAYGDAWLFDAFLDAMHNAHTPQEQRRFLMGLCDFKDAALIQRSIDLVLTDDVPTQDVAFVLVRLFANRSARSPTWDFVRQRWPKLRDRMGSLLAGRVIAATPSLGTQAHRREVARFFKANPVPSGARTLRQALERFDWYEGFKAREGPNLDAYLHGQAQASASEHEGSDMGLA